MISFCTISLNSKFETKTFIEALNRHNPLSNFEICLVHDNRVDDGSPGLFRDLQREYKNLKIMENTEQDTIEWLEKLLTYYKMMNIFPESLRDKLGENLDSIRRNTFLDRRNEFLWTALGFLYNKAVSMATGDILIIAPADYIYTFNLQALEAYVIQHRQDGIFYGKMGGLKYPVSNEGLTLSYTTAMRDYKLYGATTRRYTNYPSLLEDIHLLDFLHQKAISIGDPFYPSIMTDLCRQLESNGDVYARMHHGTHVMTKKTFDIIGGFTEEFYCRAWPDDKMNALAMRLFWKDCSLLPMEFSFNFIHGGEWSSGLCGENPENYSEEYLRARDPWIFKHPIPGKKFYNKKYWHDGYSDKNYLNNINSSLDKEFGFGGERGRLVPPVRFTQK